MSAELVPRHRTAPELATLLLELGRLIRARRFYKPGDARLANVFTRSLRAWRADLERRIGQVDSQVKVPLVSVPVPGAGPDAFGAVAHVGQSISLCRLPPFLRSVARHQIETRRSPVPLIACYDVHRLALSLMIVLAM